MTDLQLVELDFHELSGHLTVHNSSSFQQQLGVRCPDCSDVLQSGFGLNLACCSTCGCTFCARCKALYLLQPGPEASQCTTSNGWSWSTAAVDAQQQTVLAALAAAGGGLLATCSCEPVDKAAVEQQWGSAAVAYWPTGQLQQQLLLLLLLQQHQQQVIPLLSRQLLQQLQRDWLAAEAAVLQWQHVQETAQVISQHQQQRQQQQLPTDGALGNQQQPQHPGAAAQAEQVIPTSAIPAFRTQVGRTPGHTPMDMDTCNGAAAEKVPAQGWLAARSAAAACQVAASDQRQLSGQGQNQQPVDQMQVDDCRIYQHSDEEQARVVHVSTVVQQQQQEQQQQHGVNATAGSLVASAGDAAHLLQQTEETVALMTLAQQVTAADMTASLFAEEHPHPGHQQPPPATTVEVPAAMRPALTTASAVDGALGSSVLPQPQQQQNIPAPNHSGCTHEQLGMEDFEAQKHQQLNTLEDIHNLQDGQQLVPRPCDAAHAAAVLDGKGGRVQLAGLDDEGLSNAGQHDATSTAVPQLLDFGLQLSPPVVADEPVVLIAADDTDALPFWQR